MSALHANIPGNVMTLDYSIVPTYVNTLDEESTCAFCRSRGLHPMPKLKTCGRCQAVQYCSKICQKADFRLHKKFCSSVRAMRDVTKDLLETICGDPGKMFNRENGQEPDSLNNFFAAISL